jgi:putative Mg2+ transporter-C (MgtC) family protein
MDAANVGQIIPMETFALRALAALVLGVLVGLDREIKRKPLGARAYALIALGSASFTMVTLNFALGPTVLEQGVGIDPSRIVQGLVGGIGVLGAGAIIGGGSDGRLRGVGSGAAIWVVGSVGVACGLGYFMEAALIAGLTFLILFIGDWCESKAGIKDAVDQKADEDA